MKKLFILLVVLLCGCQNKTEIEPVLKNDPITATDTVGFGWQKDQDSQKAPKYAQIRVLETKDIAPSFDLRSEMSAVENQGPINSCVACAIVGALEFLQIKNGIPKNKRFLDMSKMFLYYNARDMAGWQTKDNGCYLNSAIMSLENTGMVTEVRWPYTYSRLYKRPAKSLYIVAQKKLVKDAYYIENNSIENIKAALCEGYPVVFGTSLYSSFKSVTASGIVPVPKAGEKVIGGHAMLIVGYTDKYFIVRNSWGANWGNKGYCFFPFEYFSIKNINYDFWVIRLQTNLFTKELNLNTH